MKKRFLTHVLLFQFVLAGTSLIAQERTQQAPPDKHPREHAGEHPGGPAQMDPVKVTDRMNEELGLSEAQYKEVMQIQIQFDEHMKSLRSEREDDKMHMAVKRREAGESREAALREVLNEKQFKQYQESQRERRSHMKERKR